MAEYAVPSGHIGAHAKTLVGNVVDTVTFQTGSPSSPGWGRMPKQIEVLSDGADDIYVTTNGSTPTIGGTHCYRIPPLPGASVIDVQDEDRLDAVVVKLLSDGTPTYSVSRA